MLYFIGTMSDTKDTEIDQTQVLPSKKKEFRNRSIMIINKLKFDVKAAKSIYNC